MGLLKRGTKGKAVKGEQAEVKIQLTANTVVRENTNSSKLTDALKERFCKDNGIKIEIFSEPYFSERVELLGYDDKLEQFERLLEIKFGYDEQKYFEYYNQIQEQMVSYIKESQAYKALDEDDMNKYSIQTKFKQRDIFKPSNIGKRYVSILLKKSNFSALVNYAKDNSLNFNGRSYDYIHFISRFTDEEYFYDSKNTRQEVIERCNIERIETYQLFIMNTIYKKIKTRIPWITDCIELLNKDEIIIDADKLGMAAILDLKETIDSMELPLRFEVFKLGKVVATGIDTNAYIKQIYDDLYDESLIHLELKCNNSVDTIFIHRKLNEEMVVDSDLVFYSNHGLAKLIDIPEIQLQWEA